MGRNVIGRTTDRNGRLQGEVMRRRVTWLSLWQRRASACFRPFLSAGKPYLGDSTICTCHLLGIKDGACRVRRR
jgi:hypothetical protein